MIEGLRQIAALPDPIGEIFDMTFRPSGIQVGRMRVPLGVVGIIYESRPNVTADAAALCLKSGNATVLRGGSEALHSNQAIAASIHRGLEAAGLPAAERLDKACRGRLRELLRHNDIDTGCGKTTLLHQPGGSVQAARILVVGCGENKVLSPQDFIKVVEAAAGALQARGLGFRSQVPQARGTMDSNTPNIRRILLKLSGEALLGKDLGGGAQDQRALLSPGCCLW